MRKTFDQALLNAPVLMGLKAQGHIPTIEAMLYAGQTWKQIGDVIGWCPKTAEEHYGWYRDSIAPNAMKALSLLQPWASLIPFLAKGIETRSWATKYRGPLAIHASAKFSPELRELCFTEPFQTAIIRGLKLPTNALKQDDLKLLPLGKVIATCELVDCIPITTEGDLLENPFIELVKTRLTAMQKDGRFKRVYYTQEFYFGDYTEGRYAWILDNVKALAEPIPAKGALSIWDWVPPSGFVA